VSDLQRLSGGHVRVSKRGKLRIEPTARKHAFGVRYGPALARLHAMADAGVEITDDAIVQELTEELALSRAGDYARDRADMARDTGRTGSLPAPDRETDRRPWYFIPQQTKGDPEARTFGSVPTPGSLASERAQLPELARALHDARAHRHAASQKPRTIAVTVTRHATGTVTARSGRQRRR
jgi:hypothetical protein